jgi:Tfp pilus assembly protein PilE
MKRHIFLGRSLQGFMGTKIAKKNDGHAQRGFALVGLLIAIIVIVIIATIAAPSYFGHSRNTNLKAADRDILADYLDLKERVINESTMY